MGGIGGMGVGFSGFGASRNFAALGVFVPV